MLGQGLCKSLFIHAGLPLRLLLQVLQQLSSQDPIDILDKLNSMVKGTLIASNASALLLVEAVHGCSLAWISLTG